jgi:hypothetical protein
MATYLNILKKNPGKPLIIMNHNDMLLKDIVNSNSFLGDIFFAQESRDPAVWNRYLSTMFLECACVKNRPSIWFPFF